MKAASELRGGSTFKKDGNIYIILKADRHKSTSGRKANAAQMKFKVKDLIGGKVNDITIEATTKMDDIRLDRKSMQFLYESEGDYNFMDQETFDQIALTKEDLEDAVNYIKEEMIIDILMYEERAVGVELENTVNLKITYTEPGLRGDTTGRATKIATVETGYELQVPLFIGMDELIKIDTRTGEYLERAK